MRKRLKSHFMTPYQKYKLRGRKPWKLLFQLLKLIMVTVQVNKQARKEDSQGNILRNLQPATLIATS